MFLPAKVRAILERLLDREVGKVLVAEGDDLALGHEPRELVLAGAAEGRELDATDFGADGRSQVCQGDAVGEQVREGRVRVLAGLAVLEGLEGRECCGAVPGWEVVRVLGEVSIVYLLGLGG